MYKKLVEALVENAISKYFDCICYRIAVSYNQNTGMVRFTVEAAEKGCTHLHTVRGFVGTLGQIVITTIDSKELETEKFITIN